MNSELYFISILAKALVSENIAESLQKAFDEIRAVSGQAGHWQGYLQFRQFMQEVCLSAEFEQSDVQIMKNYIVNRFAHPRTVTVSIERDGVSLPDLTVDGNQDDRTITRLIPGEYVFKLNHSVIWHGALSEKDLIWSEAFPRKALKMAADTKQSFANPTRLIQVLEGRVLIRIYAGPGSGSMQIVINDLWEIEA